jgi:N-acetylmuramoyl-L-alanine amidase
MDPSTIAFKVDGEPRAFSLSAEATTLTWRVPPEAMAGRHRIELTACNTRGRATPLLDIVLTGPQEIGFHCPLWLPADEEGTLLRFESLGADLADYRRLRLVWRSAAARQEIELPVYPGRRGWVRLALKSWPDSCEIIWDEESTGTTGMRPVPARKALPPEWQWKTLLPAEVAWPLEVVPGGAWRLRALGRQEELASWPEALDTTSPILPVKRGEPAWLEADGAMPIVIGGNRRPLAAEPGAAASDTARWRPILPELIGKRIVLDPTGGGSETDGAGPAGTRGADFNLQVAERTASLLRGAGAVVVLTRRNESWLPSEEKVLLANRQQADLFMIIQRCHETGYRFSAHHHATSLAGLRWSKLWARCIALLTTPGGGSDPEVGSVLTAPSYAYLLRHTACPALQVGLEAPVTHEIEDRLLDPACQQAQAIALFLSIASFTAGADLLDDLAQPLEIIASRSDSFPAPDRIDWIRWDGNWLWIPPRAGASRQQAVSLYRAPGLPFRGGEHTLEIHARGEWQLWSLSKSGDGSGIRLAPLLAGADQP